MDMVFKSKTIFQFIFCLSLVTFSGCEKGDEETSVNEIILAAPAETVASPNVKNLRPPLNCQVMITAKSSPPNRYDPRSLYFLFEENSYFDPKQENVCQGDIKNLWPDLSRFDAEIKAHLPNIKHIGGITQALPYFPVTEAGLKRYIDDAAKADNFADRLGEIDRSNLEGGLEYQNEIISLIREQENSYWLEEQAPVIESILTSYDLKIDYFSGEKYAYCYHPDSYCFGYRNSSGVKPEDRITDESQYELESFGPGFDWLSFTRPR